MFWQNNKKFDFLTSVLRFSIFSENGSYETKFMDCSDISLNQEINRHKLWKIIVMD